MIDASMIYKLDCDSKNIFFRCVEDSNDTIMITDAQGVLVYVNPAWINTFGFSREEAIGNTPRILHSGHHPAEFYKDMWNNIANPTIGHWRGEVINRTKSGLPVPVLLTITPFKSPERGFIGYMGIAIDLSQRKELEAKVIQQDRLASIGLLASGLAHEVGTPLGVIRGRAEFLMMRYKDETLSKSLEVIVAQIDRISKLIHSLLRISRSPTTDLDMKETDIKAVVYDVVALVGQNLKDDFARIRIEIQEGLTAYADFGRLEQVVLNLVMNSIYAIRKAIKDGRNSDHFLLISANRRRKKIALEVRDTGCGITPENMRKLFKPFFTTKEVGEGTGLGLAIVSQLLQDMGGEISVESAVNRGTSFTVLLNPVPN